MQIKELFEKRIDREIQGVIVVGQGEDTNVAQELEEYVVTRDLQKHFADFFAAYKKSIKGTTPKIGCWISGFFGSGKSHLLKILSYLLDNREVAGKRALDYFIDDKKISDPMVLADMQLAANTPSDVILFNIDSKSDSGGKKNKDAIVNVFLKVFNEMQGFCGSLPHLADLEQQLKEKGLLDEFKDNFEDEYGKPWEDSRHKFDFIQDTVVDVLEDMDFMSRQAALNWCEKAAEPYAISIEDFARRVKRYIDDKGNDHHVIFLVDEIGQYIGEDTNLMLNLQTVTEELGKECKGKAWVIVTSQQDIDSVTKVKGNDFSKIQGRFDTRLSLSSANVDEVIKKRILEKNDLGAQTLRLLYEHDATTIKNIITFDDNTSEKRLYDSTQDFCALYPFVRYQFNLLGSTLTKIRTHGASGKHLSEGERSMLALFKESAMYLKDAEVGTLVPFHLFYDGLENFLEHTHRGVIIRAFDNKRINPEGKTKDVFAINVLKTLFLIKYVEEIDSTVENVTSLMISSVHDDRATLKGQVEDALRVLQKEMLVQKQGSEYIFLTDEEQEINRLIDQEFVEGSEKTMRVSSMIFDGILRDSKYIYPKFSGRYAFGYNQIVDDRPRKSGNPYEISLRIITPMYDGNTDPSALRLRSGQGMEVLVVLPNDDSFLQEIEQYLKIEKFLRSGASEKLIKQEKIRSAKQGDMRLCNENANLYLKEALNNAVIYVNGDILNTGAKEIGARINEAVGRLVQTVYNKLYYIDVATSDADIRKMLTDSQQMTIALDNGEEPNAFAQADVLTFIQDKSIGHTKPTMKAVKDHFMRAPYGFVEDDVQWLVARLFKKGEIALSVSGVAVNLNNKTDEEILSYLTKKAFLEKLQLEVRPKVPEKQKKAVRSVMKDLFKVTPSSEDEDVVMKSFQSYCQKLCNAINLLEPKYENHAYPGKKVLAEGKKLLQTVMNVQLPAEFYKLVYDTQDDLIDFADDYEPIREFFDGEQVTIFTSALDSLKIYEDSKTYIVDRDLETAVEEMRVILRQEKPYSSIFKLPGLLDQYREAYTIVLDQDMIPVLDAIQEDRKRVLDELSTKPYAEEYKEKYLQRFRALKEKAESCTNVATLHGYTSESTALRIRLLNEMGDRDAKILEALEREQKEKEAAKGGEKDTPPVPTPPPVKPKKTRTVPIRKVVKTNTWQITGDEDIDKYLASLKQQLKTELGQYDTLSVEF
ncbi:MAG: BREX system P-loop protein BrxC [Eubacterium sp.]|nr:BREX system P-loop protein BrxC [Eubacterium sp.]